MKSDEEKNREIDRLVEIIKNSESPPIKIYGQGRGLPNLSNRQRVTPKKENIWQKIRDFFYRSDKK